MKKVDITSALNNKWTFPCLLIVSALAVYYPILGNDFVYLWDDQINPFTARGWNAQNLRAIFTEFYDGQYAPLNELLYLALYSISGYDPFWYHLASLLLHIFNALLVYICVLRLLEVSRKIETEYAKAIAFFTTLIFTIHPFNVESVAWASASKILIYSLFYILATLTFLSYLKHKKLIYYSLTLFIFFCSFLGKEQAVIFPLWILLIYWIAGYSLKSRKVWLVVTPFFLMSFVFGIITIASQTGNFKLFEMSGYPFWQRIVYACYSFVEYLTKMVFPFKLSYLYPFPSVVGDPLPQWLLLYPALLTFLLIAFWKPIATQRIWTFFLLFFVMHIAVALHIISLSRFAVVADRYVYIASIGVCYVLAYYGISFIKKLRGYKRIGLIAIFSAYLLYFGIYANIRTRVWRDSDSLKKEIRELLKERDD